MTLPSDFAKRLAAPFTLDELEWRAGHTNADKTSALALVYVTNRAIMDRLDDVVGPEGWRNEFVRWGQSGVLCGLSLYVAGNWITKWDGADETDIEATKGGLSDAMKRAAVQWGIGRYLYRMPEMWGPGRPASSGKGFYFDKKWTPPIPAEFLPARTVAGHGAQREAVTPTSGGHETPRDVSQAMTEDDLPASARAGPLVADEEMPPWIDEKIGFGKREFWVNEGGKKRKAVVAREPWRFLVSGKAGGQRALYLEEVCNGFAADEALKKKITPEAQKFWDRCAALLKIIRGPL